MVEKIESFRASDGTIHDNPHSAWRAELIAWFMVGGDVTEASAKKLVDRIASLDREQVDALTDTIDMVASTAPPPVPKNSPGWKGVGPVPDIPPHGTADRCVGVQLP